MDAVVVSSSEIFGLWIAGFLTLCVFSFLIGDNPLYKLAEHIYVGVSAGYYMSLGVWQVLIPNVYRPLVHEQEWTVLMPTALGILLLARLIPQYSWLSRWPLAFLVGVNAGLKIVYTMEAQVIDQVADTIRPLWITGDYLTSFTNIIIVVGVFTGLIYFYFSFEHKGVVGKLSRLGIWILMIALGASFGYTVMARISLLIGRIQFFTDEVWVKTLLYFGGS